MSPSRRRHRLAPAIAIVLGLAVALAGCVGPAGSGTGMQRLTVGLGFIPSVQFAPFYLAQRESYYSQAGLMVEFQNKIDPDLVTLVGQGTIDIGLADGTSVIPAVSQGIPIRYVATVYGTYPSVVFSKESSQILRPGDLKGRKLGIPGRYGSSWIMLQALLQSVSLTPEDLEIVDFPDFTQGAAVQQGVVDAATGFVNNEPVQLERTGEAVVIFHVDDVVALPGPGLIAGKAMVDSRGDILRRFIAATLRAMDTIAADPEKGLDAAIAAVPELGNDRATQRAILDATIGAWSSPLTERDGFGAIDHDGWAASIALMADLKLVPNPVTVDGLVDDRFLPAD